MRASLCRHLAVTAAQCTSAAVLPSPLIFFLCVHAFILVLVSCGGDGNSIVFVTLWTVTLLLSIGRHKQCGLQVPGDDFSHDASVRLASRMETFKSKFDEDD